MANLRQERLTPGGFEQGPHARGVRRGLRWPWVAGVLVVLLLALAWFDGGEEALRPIAQDVTLPEQGQ
ncbi:hypothetical protein [Erythrobacter sp. CCH5-A1]|jgi:hypothetical protein|uniref:hypothetical protein n=1 Tax=Erythrobacter sp. CCH5-A1 TaxID=1768792 RepID=UPI00082BD8EC|nr:hypothetical protein [Erythrobacter sp. CCH5-A1]